MSLPDRGTVQRERVVLARRRGARMVRSRVEVEQQTAVGDALVRGLVRAQLGLAMRLVVGVVVVAAALPLAVGPLGDVRVGPVPLPWVLLAGVVFPVPFVVGWVHTLLAERTEQDFTDLVDD